MNHLEKIARRYPDARITYCGETKSQKLFLGAKDRVIFKGEKLASRLKISSQPPPSCDCIILFEKGDCLCVALVEQKARSIDARKIVAQLDNCYELARRLLVEISARVRIEYRMAVFAKGGWTPSDLKIIENRNRLDSRRPKIERRKLTQDVLSLFGGVCN